jgi:LPXTG-site transpeptidase (sortase) family protein
VKRQFLNGNVMNLRRLRQLSFVSLVIGVALFGGGVGMRGYATLYIAETERRLIAGRPDVAAVMAITPVLSPKGEGRGENQGNLFAPADGPPTEIRLPDLGLWNALEPVTAQVMWQDDEIVAAWEVRDAGWHVPTGWPGRGHNVVIAGHSPSRDPGVWSRSVFRQLAYLNLGDPLELIAGRRVYTYRVNRVFAIPEGEAGTAEAVGWIAPGERERLTLITCWPPHTAAYRVLVIADPVRSIEKTERTKYE